MARCIRARHNVLIGNAKIAGALIVAFIWPILCTRVTWAALHRVQAASATRHLVAGATIFAILSWVTLVAHPLDALRRPATCRRVGFFLAASLTAFLALTVAAGAPVWLVIGPFALATFIAAAAEEAVFRRYLPDRLSATLRRAGVRPAAIGMAAIAIPQLSFAAAHAESSAFFGAGTWEFAGLFLAGVLFQGLVRVGGLWSAAAIHAALNLIIALSAMLSRR